MKIADWTAGAVAALLLLPAGAQAAVSWTFTDTSTRTTNIDSSGWRDDLDAGGWEYQGSDGDASTTDPAVAVTAWGESPDAGFPVAHLQYPSGDALEGQDRLVLYSGGIGIKRDGEGSPNHAIDSIGLDELVILHFEEEVSLETFRFGWAYDSNYNNQADATVLAYTGPVGGANPSGRYLTSTAPTITSSGWEVVGHYADVGTNVNRTVSSPTVSGTASPTLYSSYWAIGAFMANIDSTSGNGLGPGNDAFKLAAVTGTQQPGGGTPPAAVPLPPTLLLIALGLPFLYRRLGT